MIKELLTQATRHQGCLVVLLSFFALHSFGQTATFNPEPCTCLNNEDYDNDISGQFTSTIEVASVTGETWTVTSRTNVYDPASPGTATPSLLTTGTSLTETAIGSGTYILQFLHVDNIGFSITVSNGSTPLTLTNSDIVVNCRYPRAEITGDAYVCSEQQNAVYSVEDIAGATYSWSLTGGGTFDSATNDHEVRIDWGSTTGTYTLSVDVSTSVGCMETATQEIVIEEVQALACNNSVNLTMDADCQIDIVADMILEDFEYENDSYSVLLEDADGNFVSNGTLASDYIGQTLKVTIIQNCGGNACWGYVKIEDKSIPDLTCPIDATIGCNASSLPVITGVPTLSSGTSTLQSDGTYLVTGFDNCGNATLTYTDEETINGCSDTFSASIVRTWVVTDLSGNSKSCSHTISVTRSSTIDVTFPQNYDDALTGPGSLQACNNTNPSAVGYWIALDTGYPSPESTGYPLGTSCSNMHVSYVDEAFAICGNHSFKIQRTWTVHDQCTDDVVTAVQLITVMDNQPPVLSAVMDQTQLTGSYSCGADFLVPEPIVINECSNWDYTVLYKPEDNMSADPLDGALTDGVVRDPITGQYTIENLVSTGNEVWVIYVVTDECGNETIIRFEIEFEDEVQPIPVCDQYTYLTLNELGVAYGDVSTFDDGSWDNCGVDRITIRRMNNNGCSQPSGNELVKFCCQDVGTVQMVQLTVYDAAGNSNFCMVEVEVQDYEPPVISCPADIEINCGDQISNLSVYGSATTTDICGANITESSVTDINDCGLGSVIRTFTATDNAGNTATCQQVITIQDDNAFYINNVNSNDSTDDVVWPADHDIDGCIDTPLSPDDLSYPYDRPVFSQNACSNVVATHEDVIFQYVEETCYKILRTWTVIDWCQFDQQNPGSATWQYTQLIKINNNNSPTITAGCSANDIEITMTNSCSANVNIAAAASDDCTEQQNLVWSYSVDYDNDGSLDLNGSGSSINRNLNFGTHEICWTVADDCGNSSSCCQTFTIEDDKAPTPYCLDAIVSSLNPVDGALEIWASDFNNGATDNCDPSVTVSFSANPNDQSRTFTCDDVANGIIDTILIDIYFIDSDQNFDFCTSRLIIQDNSDICTDIVAPILMAKVAGSIYSPSDQLIEDVSVMIMDQDIQSPEYQMTNASGEYAFNSVEMYHDYMLEPSKDVDHLNGVSTLDLVIIQKHILGIQTLDTPYKIIAADINKSESVSAVDLIELRKMILGIFEEFPNNESYNFVQADFSFQDPTQPFPFENQIDLYDLENDQVFNDFIAIKVGDVNESANYNLASDDLSSRSNHQLFIEQDEITLAAETVEVDIHTQSISNLIGLETSLSFNSDALAVRTIMANGIAISDDQYHIVDNVVNISWSSLEALSFSDGDVLFSIQFDVIDSSINVEGLLEINANSTLKNEIYTQQSDGYIVKDLSLSIRNASGDYQLFQNTPNPFTDFTSIGFSMPKNETVSLDVFDTSGRIIYSKTKHFTKGLNQIEISTDQIQTSGILYYRIQTNSYTATKKMIVVQ